MKKNCIKPRKKLRFVVVFICIFAFLTVLPAVLWVIAPYFADDPLSRLKDESCTVVTDCKGVYLASVGKNRANVWNFRVKLEDVSQDAVRALLVIEDSRFFSHSGVDYKAIARALWQDVSSFKILSGASTISMSVARMAWPEDPKRSIISKFKQAVRARKMEKLHSKKEILEAFLNEANFGGRIKGIEAAAQYYFGKKAKDLTLAESALLMGIPQRPNGNRPDTKPQNARRRFKTVQTLLDAHSLPGKDMHFPVCRNFKIPPPFAVRMQFAEIERFIPEEAFVSGGPDKVAIDLDMAFCDSLRDMLKRRVGNLQGVHDAAAVVIENSSGKVRGYVGTLDFTDPDGGEIDAARICRSAGSTLKPFIYQEALDGGLITSQSPIDDTPVNFNSYKPDNFDGTFCGTVTATYALVSSLNTPAVRLVARLGTNRVTRLLRKLNLYPSSAVSPGLTLALGTGGCNLYDLTFAYTNLVGRQTAKMLRAKQMPGTVLDVAWKTGTSNNNCDAWCVAFTPDWTVGVWFGNKSGKRSKDLVGAVAAAPAAAEAMEMLYAGSAPVWDSLPEPCVMTPPAADCGEKEKEPDYGNLIISPSARVYKCATGRDEASVRFESSASSASWYLDGEYLGEWSGAKDFNLKPGLHRVNAISAQRSGKHDFSVLE